MKDLKQRAIRGGFVKICAQGGNFIIRMGALIVLARLLEPKDFGLVGMVAASIGVLNVFSDFGLSSATVQHRSVSDEQMSTLFWISLLVGTILGLLALAVAPVVAMFYQEPRLLGITTVLAAGFLLNAAGAQHSAILQRQLRFVALAWISILSLLAGTVVGISLAAQGYGYWALVVMTVMTSLFNTVCLWVSANWLPGRLNRRVGIRSMLNFGGTITLNGLVVYVSYNLDKILLGRFFGAEALGIYGRAYQLISIPTDNLNTAFAGVAFPALSRLQDDPDRLRRYFLGGYSLFLALTLPATIVCTVFSEDLILVVLGSKWAEVAPIFRLLAPTIVAFALINPMSWLLLSLGMARRNLRVALVVAPVVIMGYSLGLPFGPKGVAIGLSTAMTLMIIPCMAWCVRGTSISLRDIWLTVSRPMLSGVVAAAVVLGLEMFYTPFVHPLPRLAIGATCLFATYYWTLLHVMGQRAFYWSMLRELKSQARVNGTAP